MKKVYHLITTILRGGAENQLLVVVKEQVRQGLDVHIVYLKGEAELEQDLIQAGASIHHELVGKCPLFQPWHMTRLIAREKVILHAHLPRAELVGLATIGNHKFFSTRHNAESFFPGAPGFLSRFLSRMVERRAEKIIAISNSVKSFLLDTREVKDEDKIEVVYYGYFPISTAHSLKSDLPSDQLRLGTISRLAPQKDLPTMILSFRGYRNQNPNSTLSILGAGPLELELKQFVSALDLDSNVEFLGRSSNTRDFLLSLDVFILTSLYEGFGMVLLEAMDAGIPIVASQNSAIPEVLGENFPGLCLTGDVDDFLSKISALKNSDYRKSILKIQQRRLNLFDSVTMGEKLIKVYES